MRVLIVGAAGPLGLELTRQALEEGHEATAFVRDPARFPLRHAKLLTVEGDVLRLGSLDPSMAGKDAVICTLGRGPTWRKVTLFSEGTLNILRAMQRHNIRRVLCITGIGAGDSKGHGGFWYDRLVQPLLLRTIYEDKTRQEELVRQSDRDWILIRPARLTNGPAARRYVVRSSMEGVVATQISRADVSEFAVEQIAGNKYLYKTVLLTDPV